MPDPLFSIIVPVHNGVSTIRRAVESVRAQTFSDWELRIEDDASTDDTAGLLDREYGSDTRIHVALSATSGGAAVARNRAIEAARGAWIALLDADDAWRPERLERMQAMMEDDVDLVFDNLEGWDDRLGLPTGARYDPFPDDVFTPARLLDPMRGGFDYGYLKPTMRKSFLDEHGVRYDPAMRDAEDLVLYTTLAFEGARTRHTDEALYLYTTRVSASTGRVRSGGAAPPPVDLIVGGLERLRTRFADRSPEDLALIDERIEYVQEREPVEKFNDARHNRDLVAMARLLVTQRPVRAAMTRKVRERIGAGTGS